MSPLIHIGARIEPELYSTLQDEAEEIYEGNVSFVLRKAIKFYIKHADLRAAEFDKMKARIFSS